MLIPLIEKDAAKNDFTCRDGEIELLISPASESSSGSSSATGSGFSGIPVGMAREVRFSLEAALPYPTATVRVPLQSGDGSKCALMLAGEGSRVDASAADRISQAIVAKAAVAFADILADTRAAGLFMLPFRAFSNITYRDSVLPSAQAILLPCSFPPHPEITASSVDDEGVTLSLRLPVRPQRLLTVSPESLPTRAALSTFVSRSLWVPDPKEIGGSLGSVRSASGGSAMGIRFSFMSESRMRASVVAPDKYYRYIGNDSAGWHIMSKAEPLPDYSACRDPSGNLSPFPVESLRASGSDTDPLEWIADWRKSGCGYLPLDTVTTARDTWDFDSATSSLDDSLSAVMQEMKAMTGLQCWLLTRPMTFSSDERSRHRAEATAVGSMRVYGLKPGAGAIGVLLGSADGAVYEPVMTFSPTSESVLLAPRRPFWRLLLGSSAPLPALCLEVSGW